MLDNEIHESILSDMKQASEADEVKTLISVRLTRKAIRAITALAFNNKRVFADMLRLLVDEALEARKTKQ
jgi:hypothetical protein